MGAAYGPERVVASARHDQTLVVLEGVHAVKHAVRFGAECTFTCSPDPQAITTLITELAPDLVDHVVFGADLVRVDADTWSAVTGGHALPSPLLGIARRPAWTIDDIARRRGRVVALENPRHHGNIGAAIRVAAAADAAGVVVFGGADPWHAMSVRGAAGLQFALPVVHVDPLGAGGEHVLTQLGRPCYGIDPRPGAATPAAVEAHATVLFGTERGGLTASAHAHCDNTVAIPMRAGVSSLNLATAVAVMLYAEVANGRS